MSNQARFLIEHRRPQSHDCILYLKVKTDKEFIEQLKELPVFTSVWNLYTTSSSVEVAINPIYSDEDIELAILPAINALEMRAGRPDGFAFERVYDHMGHSYNLFLQVKIDKEFIEQLKELPVFYYVGGYSSSYVTVQINPVIGVKAAERQIRPLVKALAERQL